MKRYLDKQIKIREKNLKYDFLPSMLEIIERPQNKLANVLLFLVIALIITALLWANFFQIDMAVTAYGVITPENGVITLVSSYGGKLSDIYVEENSFVTAGANILSLDSTEAELNLKECKYNLEVLNVQREVYKKISQEIDIKTIDTSIYGEYSEIADAILLENDMYKSKLNLLENKEDKKIYTQEYDLSVRQNINNLDVEIFNAEIELENAENALDALTLKAPLDGTIMQLSIPSEGSFITAGETLGYLLPKNGENLFTAYVSDEDIHQIHVGDTVNVKIGAYDNTEYEYIEGTVQSIGNITVDIENIGVAYQLEIKLLDIPYDIKVGMEGNCYIVTGKRSVLNYFIEPFIDGLNDSLKEN